VLAPLSALAIQPAKSAIGAKLPIRDVRAPVAVGGKADLETHTQTPGPPTA